LNNQCEVVIQHQIRRLDMELFSSKELIKYIDNQEVLGINKHLINQFKNYGGKSEYKY